MESTRRLAWIWTSKNTLQVKELDCILPLFVSIHIKSPPTQIYLISHVDIQEVKFPVDFCIYNSKYLVSNLQKAVRRKKMDVAFATAHQLLLQDPNCLLRRLPIIATEDVKWTTWTNYLVWIMCWYSKTKSIGEHHFRIIFGIIKHMCHSADPSVSSFQLAIWIRQQYGGMSGDLCLLDFTSEKRAWDEESGELVEFTEPVPMFSTSHMLLEAIDFHCSDIINKYQKTSDIPYAVLKEWIWNFRSGVNVRKPWTRPNAVPMWNSICSELDRISTLYWNNSIIQAVSPIPKKRQRTITEFLKSKSDKIIY
jgi:hypothetical protein